MQRNRKNVNQQTFLSKVTLGGTRDGSGTRVKTFHNRHNGLKGTTVRHPSVLGRRGSITSFHEHPNGDLGSAVHTDRNGQEWALNPRRMSKDMHEIAIDSRKNPHGNNNNNN